LTVWFIDEAIAASPAAPRTTRGGQAWYSPLAILTPEVWRCRTKSLKRSDVWWRRYCPLVGIIESGAGTTVVFRENSDSLFHPDSGECGLDSSQRKRFKGLYQWVVQNCETARGNFCRNPIGEKATSIVNSFAAGGVKVGPREEFPSPADPNLFSGCVAIDERRWRYSRPGMRLRQSPQV
jgi:hypothetical protein